MSVIQLSEMIPVDTPLGRGLAILYEPREHEAYWTVVLRDGAIVAFTQDRIRVARSYTHRRGISDAEMRKILAKKVYNTD